MPNQNPASPSPPRRPNKRLIDVSVDDLPAINADVWEAIQEQNEPPALFTHGGGMVRVRFDYHDDGAIVEPMTADIMRHELSEWAHWRKGNNIITSPPTKVVKNALASRVVPLPKLQRIVTVPVFGPDGSLQTDPGYNPASGVIYAPPRGYKSLPVPDRIINGHLDDAKKLLEELIEDFPFSCNNAGDSSDHDNAIALILLPFVRDLIDGPTPNHLIEASMPGSGKGLLASSLLYPGLGEISGAPQPENDAELKKLITAKIRACAPLIFFDNISRTVASGELAAALTMNMWDDRILGESATVNARVRSLWLMTGNNVAMSSEITRRTIRIRLAPQTDRPEERSDFHHPDQIGWVIETRAQLVWAAHVICRHALQQKLPRSKVRTIGSYERWVRVVGSILECAGYNHFLENYREYQAGSNTEREALALFAMTWFEWLERTNGSLAAQGLPAKLASTTSELWELAKNIDGLPIGGKDEGGKQKSLGRYLKGKHEVIIEYAEDDPTSPVAAYKFKIISRGLGKGNQRGSQTWGVECLEQIPR